MLFYHCTPRGNVPNILKQGLLVEYSQHLFYKRVWLVTGKNHSWAKRHVAAKYGLRLEQIYTFTTNLAHYQVVKWRAGVYFREEDIPPAQLRGECVAAGKVQGRGTANRTRKNK